MKHLVRNAIFNSGSWSVHVLVAFFTTPYIVYKLSAEVYGIYALLTGLIGFYGLLDLGLGQGVTKFVAQYNTDKNDDGIQRSINAALMVQVLLGLTASALILLFNTEILNILNVAEAHFSAASNSLNVFALGFFLKMIATTFDASLQGLQRYDITGKVDAFINILVNVGIVMLLFWGFGLEMVVNWTVFSTVLSFIILGIILKKQLPFWKFSFRVSAADFKTLFNFSGYVFISRISSLFTNYIVRFFISAYLGTTAVTYYVVPMKIVNMVGGFLGSLFRALFPYASELGARGDKERIKKVFIEGSKYFAALSLPACLIIIVFARPIMILWMGGPFAEETWLILAMLASVSSIGALSTVPTHVAIGLGYTKLRSIFSVITVVLYVLLLPLLTDVWQIYGVIASVFFASTVPGIVFVLYFSEKILDIPLFYYLRRVVGFHLVPITLTVIFLSTGVGGILPASLFSITAAVLTAGIYFGGMISLGWLPIASSIWKLINKNA